MASISLTKRRQAIEHCIALAGKSAGDTVIDAAQEGVKVLRWLEQREELFRQVERLSRQHPEMVALLETFPGSQLSVSRSGKCDRCA